MIYIERFFRRRYVPDETAERELTWRTAACAAATCCFLLSVWCVGAAPLAWLPVLLIGLVLLGIGVL